MSNKNLQKTSEREWRRILNSGRLTKQKDGSLVLVVDGTLMPGLLSPWFLNVESPLDTLGIQEAIGRMARISREYQEGDYVEVDIILRPKIYKGNNTEPQ